jgi:orotate phosphoribosyltransferase
VVFFYGAFPGALDSLAKEGIAMHYLCTWHDVLAAAKAGKYFTPEAIAGVETFLADPVAWSVAHGGKGA